MAAALLIAVLVLLATRGGLFLYAALGLAGLVAMVCVLGAERAGILMLMGAYFTAPFYKGTAPSLGSPVTGTDGLLVLGFILLTPRMLRGHLKLPPAYVIGVTLVLFAGLFSSLAAIRPAESLINLTFWMIVMVLLPVALTLMAPSKLVVDLLASSFVVGQLFSFAVGTAQGNIGQNRYAGLSTHPNYFAQAGMLSIALLIYLIYRHFGRSWLISTALVLATGACLATVVLSGSRAATVVVAVLILMVPVVERSAVTGFVLAGLGALLLVALPIVAGASGEGSSLDRLTGGGGSAFSDSARTLGLNQGIDRFFAHPLRGDGLIDLFDIHNNFLEVAVAVGIFGLAGYLLVLFTFARPLFGTGEMRRLTYCVWGYIGFGATVPSLYDRSVWVVVALGVVSVVEFERIRSRRATEQAPTTAADVGVPERRGGATLTEGAP